MIIVPFSALKTLNLPFTFFTFFTALARASPWTPSSAHTVRDARRLYTLNSPYKDDRISTKSSQRFATNRIPSMPSYTSMANASAGLLSPYVTTSISLLSNIEASRFPALSSTLTTAFFTYLGQKYDSFVFS